MPQLKFYVSDDVEERIRARALEEGRAVSDLIAEILMSHFSATDPQGNYFSRFFGSWTGNLPEVRRSPPIKRRESDLDHVELYSDQAIGKFQYSCRLKVS